MISLRSRELDVPAPSAPGAVVATCRSVTVSYAGVDVVRDVDLDVRAGRVLALVGPNGAGKSTLLGVLAGDHQPSSGVVLIDGRRPGAWAANDLAVRRGVLLQQVDISFPFTATQVVRMGRAPWAGTSAEDWDDDVIALSMQEADVAPFAGRVYTSLSGGERARAALARVLAQEPAILLLDEPTASLDLGHQELVMGVARHRAERGDAVVVVLHDLGLAAAHADEVVLLENGRVRATGSPGQVFDADLLSEVYRCRIDVFPHPRTGLPVVQPYRDRTRGEQS